MTHSTAFDFFTRSAFGIEPGSRIGTGLEQLSSSIKLGKGQIAPLDQTREQIVFLASGATKLSAQASEGNEQIVAFHFSGDIISVSVGGIFAYLLTSLTDCELLVFPAHEFFEEVSSEKLITRSLLERLPAALHRCRDKAVALGQQSAAERLSGFLLAMNERIGHAHKEGRLIDLPMTRGEIGASLGLTIETISRQIGSLRDRGVIETRGRSRIILLNSEALKQCAGQQRASANYYRKNLKFDLDQCEVGRTGIAR